MDIRDKTAGAKEDFFWFKGKTLLLEILLSGNLINRDNRILNLGAGTGDDIPVINPFGEVYAMENDSESLLLLKGKSSAVVIAGDAVSIPFSPESFDVVVCLDVLEHIHDDKKAVIEIYRVLKPGGKLILTVPAFMSLFSAHDRALGHFRRYNRKTVKALFREFIILELGFWMFSLFFPLSILRLFERDRKNPRLDYPDLPKSINRFLSIVLAIENRQIRHGMKLPFGTTIYGVFKKPE